MKIITSFLALAALFFCASYSYAQSGHSLQVDDGHGNYSIIIGSNPGGTYTITPGGGTLLTSNGSGSSLAWLVGGNINPTSTLLGNNTVGGNLDLRAGNSTLISLNGSSGVVTIPGSVFGINGVLYTWPSSVGSANQVLTTNASGVLSWGGAANGTVNSVSATLPLSVTNPTSTPNITIANAMADGTTKGAATFRANDFNDNGSGLISLDYINAQFVGGSQNGFLSSTDWNTFNNKQTALSGGVPNTITKWTSASAIGNSSITDNGTDVSTSGNLKLGGSNKLLSFKGDGVGVSTFAAGAQGGTTIAYTLPIAAPAVNGQFLSSTTLGVMSWTTAGLVNFTESLDNSNHGASADNSVRNVAGLSAIGTATDIDVMLSPKGAGALQANPTDGAVAGGNKRGTNAVDWQTSRTINTQVASGNASVVSGGIGNTSSGDYSSVGGGETNIASGFASTIGGGGVNIASGFTSTIGGGFFNSAIGSSSTVGGGAFNLANGQNSTVSGGNKDSAMGTSSTVSGGDHNKAGSDYAVVGGGFVNTAKGSYSVVSGGTGNIVSGLFSSIVGGLNNNASGNTAFIGGGSGNKASADNTTIGGGIVNSTTGTTSTISGGSGNIASNTYSTIAGGLNNRASGYGSYIGGGGADGAQVIPDTASGNASVVSGGIGNTSSGKYSSIGGGSKNKATGNYTSIPGGYGLTLSDSGSFGFLGGNTGSNNMTVNAANTSVLGNTDLWLANNDTVARALRFYEPNSTTGVFPPSGINYSAFKAQAQTVDINYSLPSDTPTVVGQVLAAKTSGTSPVLEWTGAPRGAVVSKTAAYTAVSSDRFIFVSNSSATAYSITLPTAANKGQLITVTKTDANANNISVVAATGQTLVQIGTRATLTAQGYSVTLAADGSSTWYVVAHEAADAAAIVAGARNQNKSN